MSKRKTLRRLSSAALLSLAMYSQTLSPAWAKEVRSFEANGGTRIERRVDVKRKVGEVVIGRGEVKNISGDTLVVTRNQDGVDFNVVVDEKTKINKTGGKGTLKDIAVGHLVSVVGKVQNGDESLLRALSIKDLNVEKKSGSFKGRVNRISGSNMWVDIKKSGTYSVFTDKVRIEDRNGSQTDLDHIGVGDVVKIKGVLDKNINTFSEVSLIKIYK